MALPKESSMVETHIDVPNTLPDVITAGSGTGFSGTFSSELDPSILLKIPNAFGEKTGCDQVEKARRDHKEDLQRGLVTALVDEVTH